MFNKILRDLRSDENLSIMQLSKEVKISPFKLAGYELGLILPKDTDELEPIAKYFKVSVDFLLGIEGDPSVEMLTGNALPQKLRDYGIEQMGVRKGHIISDDEADKLIEWMKSQNISKT